MLCKAFSDLNFSDLKQEPLIIFPELVGWLVVLIWTRLFCERFSWLAEICWLADWDWAELMGQPDF